jgi:hypothetical protein
MSKASSNRMLLAFDEVLQQQDTQSEEKWLTEKMIGNILPTNVMNH